MSLDDQVHPAPPPERGRRSPSGGADLRPEGPGARLVATLRALLSLVWHTAGQAFVVVGRACTGFFAAVRDWSLPGRDGDAADVAEQGSARRSPSSATASVRSATATGVRGLRRAAATAGASAGAARERMGVRPATAGVPTSVSGASRRRRAEVAAVPLPANPAAPRPRLLPEDGRPFVVKTGMLLIATVAGAAALVIALGALAPRALTDVAGAFNFDVVLPDDATLAGLAQPSRVYASDGTLLAELRAEVDREVVPLDEIPMHLQEAVIAAEDRKFYEHKGYSIEGIGRALLTNLRAGEVNEGGSTLTQQVAKENFLTGEQTLDRKISELFYAMKLEEEFTKDELLERYLNQTYFGVSAYGVQAAAQEYFGVDVSELTVDQSAVLAGLIPAPSAYNPRANPERAVERRDDVLDDMVEIGAITPEVRDEAQQVELEVIDHAEPEIYEPYVVAAVRRLFLQDPTFGATRQEREDALFRGNLDITTTLDPDLQRDAEEVIAERFEDSEGPTASIATVDPGTGGILAFASGQDFDNEQFDYALQGRQQPGSAFKTFVLATALQQGFSPDLVLDGDSGVEITYDNGRQTYEPSNYGGADYGDIDMRRAIRSSVNTYFVQLFSLVGMENAVDMAGRLGINVEQAIGDRTDYGPSLTLGGLLQGVTPVEMAGAYAAFAAEGVFHEPYLIEKVVEGDGTVVVDRTTDDGERIFSEELNSVIVDMLRTIPAPGGTATSANIANWQEAGKTGTTNDNTDAWFVGFTPVLSTAVWVGYPDADITMPGATGGGTAAPIWAEYMRRAHEDREVVTFPSPDVDYGELFGGESVTVPNVIGRSEAGALQELAGRKLVGNVNWVNSSSPAGTVIWTSPRRGSSAAAGDRVTIGVSTGYVPPPPPPPAPEPDPAPQNESTSDDNQADGDDSGGQGEDEAQAQSDGASSDDGGDGDGGEDSGGQGEDEAQAQSDGGSSDDGGGGSNDDGGGNGGDDGGNDGDGGGNDGDGGGNDGDGGGNDGDG